MRVIITSRIYRPEPSAASLYLGALADELVRRGDDVEVLTAAPPKGMPMPDSAERVRMFPVLRDKRGYVRGFGPYLSFDVPLALRLLFAKRPDLVFVEPPPTTGAVARVICAIRRIPYVYDAADIWSDAAQLEPVSSAVIKVLRWIESFALRGATHLVTISQGVVDRARSLGVHSPISVTGFGADTREFGLTKAAPAEPLFLYAGSYSAWHGADVLIDAFAEFLQTHPGYTLRFIGNGAEQSQLEARGRELGISDSVEYLDPVAPAELLPHMAGAVASLATIKPGTTYEYSYASKVFSSLAAGCPVLFSGPGPTGKVIEAANAQVRAGTAVEYDASLVAAAMRDLADHPATAQQRADLSEYAAREHSMAAVASRVADILHNVVKARQ